MSDADNNASAASPLRPCGVGRVVLGVTNPTSDSQAQTYQAIASHICTGWKRARPGQDKGVFTREAPVFSAFQFLGDVPADQPRVVRF